MFYGSRKRSYDQGGCVRGGDLRLRCVTFIFNFSLMCDWHVFFINKRISITLSPSQTLRCRLVRTTNDGRRRECSARRRPSRLYFSHFATRTVYNTVDLYAVYAAIFVQNRVFCLPNMHSTPLLGGSRRHIPTPFGMEKLDWRGYPMVKTFRRYLYSFWRNSRTW